MLQTSIEIDVSEFQKALEARRRGLRAAVSECAYLAASYLVDRIKDNILESTPAGRIYIIRGVWHQASAPGQPPAVLTGDLLKGFFVRAAFGYREKVATAYIGNHVPYAIYLEYGTYKMAPRPYVSPIIFNPSELQSAGEVFADCLVRKGLAKWSS